MHLLDGDFMTSTDLTFWKKCSSCKKPIPWGGTYYVCSVSTCNGQRTGYVFCSVICFENHLPGARHRDAAAMEMTAPRSQNPEAPTKRIVSTGSTKTGPSSAAPQEVLVIASRLKEYIQTKSDFSTSASVMEVLSQHLRVLCERGIENARADGRKTVMDRDFQFLKNLK